VFLRGVVASDQNYRIIVNELIAVQIATGQSDSRHSASREKRVKWQGPDVLPPRKHTIAYDFK
jgi:hypothetical protein